MGSLIDLAGNNLQLKKRKRVKEEKQNRIGNIKVYPRQSGNWSVKHLSLAGEKAQLVKCQRRNLSSDPSTYLKVMHGGSKCRTPALGQQKADP